MKRVKKLLNEAKTVLIFSMIIGQVGFLISFYAVSPVPTVCLAAFIVSFFAAALVGVLAGICDEYRVSIRIERKR